MRNSSQRSPKEALGLLIFVSLIASLGWLTHSGASNSVRTPSESPGVQGKKQPPGQCSSCPPPSPRRIYAPAIDLNEAQSCEIVLNSRSANPIDITPTFYTAGGDAIIGNPIRLQPAEIRFVPVEQLMPRSIRGVHRWGGIALSYTGNVLEVWAQITFHGIGGGSIDETFNVLEEPGSDTREAVWWMPRQSTAILALGNSSGNAVRANVQFSPGESETVDIPAGKTKFVRRHAGGNQAKVESVKIVTQGEPGAIRLAGLIVGDDDSFASSIRFYDTKKTAQPNLYAINLRLKRTTPRIVLKNTSDAPVTAQPLLLTSNGNQDNPVELPSLTIGSRQVVDLDLSGVRAAAASRSDLDSVGVRIENSGAPGSLIGAAYSTDHATGLTYDVPLRDTGATRNRTGSYPWRIDGDYSTIVSVSNAGNQPAAFQVEIRYAGGPYSIRPRQLKPGETAYFDLRKLRDEQTPDRTGKTLPLTLDRGQFHWSVVATPGGGQIIGRAEVRGRSAHVVSSYSCPTCCPDRGPYGGFDPTAYGLAVFAFASTGSYGEMFDCYGNNYPQNILWYTLTTNNSAVATADWETQSLYGEGVGSTYVVGHFWEIEWEFYESENGGACREWDYFPSSAADVAVHPKITGSHTLWWFNGETVSGYATQITLSTSSIGNSYHWAVVTGGSKVSLSDDGADSITLTSNGKSDSANDVGIQVSIDGQVSDQFNITVFAPNDLLQGTVATTSDSTWGYATHINYYIRDQFTTQLPSGVPVNEQWTTGIFDDYTGNDWRRSNPHGFTTVSIAAFSDLIQGEESNRTPTPTGPGTGTAVYHWGQAWYVGSTTPGSGRRVQSDTLQKYTAHAEHQNIVTPNP